MIVPLLLYCGMKAIELPAEVRAALGGYVVVSEYTIESRYASKLALGPRGNVLVFEVGDVLALPEHTRHKIRLGPIQYINWHKDGQKLVVGDGTSSSIIRAKDGAVLEHLEATPYAWWKGSVFLTIERDTERYYRKTSSGGARTMTELDGLLLLSYDSKSESALAAHEGRSAWQVYAIKRGGERKFVANLHRIEAPRGFLTEDRDGRIVAGLPLSPTDFYLLFDISRGTRARDEWWLMNGTKLPGKNPLGFLGTPVRAGTGTFAAAERIGEEHSWGGAPSALVEVENSAVWLLPVYLRDIVVSPSGNRVGLLYSHDQQNVSVVVMQAGP